MVQYLTGLFRPYHKAGGRKKFARLVDESGLAVILKNNKPRYVVLDFAAYDQAQRQEMVSAAADQLIEENLEAFRELAK